jgi:hypothetical protein
MNRVSVVASGCAGAASLLLAACTTVQPARVTAFGQAVNQVKVQVDQTFVGINQMVSADEVDRAIMQPKLTDDDVGVVLKLEDIAKWDKAFAEIDAYVANLTLLLSPDRAAEFGAAATKLGAEVARIDPNALPSAGVAAGFAELGRLLIEAKAESDAVKAARQADPGMQMIFSEMALAVGETNLKGLRGTVTEHWKTRLAEQQLAFLKAKAGSAERRTAVLAYIDFRNQRDAQDLQLASLRRSLLDLAAAHSALARGSDSDLAAAIGLIQQESEATRSLFDQFNALKPKPKSKS